MAKLPNMIEFTRREQLRAMINAVLAGLVRRRHELCPGARRKLDEILEQKGSRS